LPSGACWARARNCSSRLPRTMISALLITCSKLALSSDERGGSSTRCSPCWRHAPGRTRRSGRRCQLVALADQLGQFHQRAFAQVVGAGLEAQAEQGDLAFVVAFDDVEGVLHLGFVAAHQRVEQRCFTSRLAAR
jgi:hypothetical protein